MAAGRPTKYEDLVKPRLSEIAEWRKDGVKIEDIADRVGVARSTFNLYISKYKELSDTIKGSTSEYVRKLYDSLSRAATGYQYVEEKKIFERDKITGKMEHVRTEQTVKSQPPNIAALNLALKNFDRANWSNDPQMLELRRKELELKAKKQEEDDW